MLANKQNVDSLTRLPTDKKTKATISPDEVSSKTSKSADKKAPGLSLVKNLTLNRGSSLNTHTIRDVIGQPRAYLESPLVRKSKKDSSCQTDSEESQGSAVNDELDWMYSEGLFNLLLICTFTAI